MKRFRFPLRPVSVLRAHREVLAREAFGAAVHAYVRAEENLAAARTRLAAFAAALAAGRRERFSAAGEAQALAAYRRDCTAEAETERAMLAARATMQQRRGEYLDAHRKVEVMQRLEAKARSGHRLETNRAEQAEFDDFAARRGSRQAASFSP